MTDDVIAQLATGPIADFNRLRVPLLRIAPWLSAAYDDPQSCPEFKADIEAFFAALPRDWTENASILPPRTIPPHLLVEPTDYDPILTVDQSGPPEPWYGFRCRKTNERRTINKADAPLDPRSGPDAVRACWDAAIVVPGTAHRP